jgi:hypothetical protein|tara:strand:- start:715 stop:942 length:228 start_codon:yes stop_codon:yes gene_type:complete
MSKLITINCDGEIETHIAGNHTDHVSLCGLDGFEDDGGIFQSIQSKTGKKVDCQACVKLWKIATAIPKKLIGEAK